MITSLVPPGNDEVFAFEVSSISSNVIDSNFKAQSDGNRNVYASVKDHYFKVSPNGIKLWERDKPVSYQATTTDGNNSPVGQLYNIAVSPNGEYVVIGGKSGVNTAGVSPNKFQVTRIRTSDGIPEHSDTNGVASPTVVAYESAWDTSTGLYSEVSDIVVNNNGICHAVGLLQNISVTSHEFCRISVNYNESQTFSYTSIGKTNGAYGEQWHTVDCNDTYVVMGGHDSNTSVTPNGQGFSCYNWTMNEDTGNPLMLAVNFSKTYNGASFNGLKGQGVTVEPTGTGDYANWMFANYAEDTNNVAGILAFNTSGAVQWSCEITNNNAWLAANPAWGRDVEFYHLATDGTNVYGLGWIKVGDNTNGQKKPFLACIDIASQSVQWGRSFGHTTEQGNGISNEVLNATKLRYNPVTECLDVSLQLMSTTPMKGGFFSLPKDGNWVGWYGDWQINNETFTSTSYTRSWNTANPGSFGDWQLQLIQNDVNGSTNSIELSTTNNSPPAHP